MKPAVPTASNKRPPVPRRLLGDARRETSAAGFISALKRRRLERSEDVPADDEEDDYNPTDTRALDDNDVAVFADAVYEEDDAEADEIYAQVEQRMKSRRQKQREEKLQEELKKYRDANPTVRQQFADLKADLKNISNDAWASIPDIGDRSIKKQKFESFTPVPDSVLTSAQRKVGYVATDSDGEEDATTDLAAIGQGRTGVLGQNLDRAGNSVTEKATVDADNYLSQLSGMKLTSKSEIGDVKRARRLLESITQTNSTHAPGWIAAAHVWATFADFERRGGELGRAQEVLRRGIASCGGTVTLWLMLAKDRWKAEGAEAGRAVLREALAKNGEHEEIWLAAAKIETESGELRKAREMLRQGREGAGRGGVGSERASARVFMKSALVERQIEDAEAERQLLEAGLRAHANAEKLWLMLAQWHERRGGDAGEVYRAAVKECAGAAAVWIGYARWEEGCGRVAKARAILERARSKLSDTRNGSEMAWRESVLLEARRGDEDGATR
ncbi:unnamed protein product, partial [Agarophyton chilense]